jgi:RNase P subunit RPR2
MPQRIYCSGCQTTLYDGLELESPTEIIYRHNGVCPKCSKKLTFDPDAVKTIPDYEHEEKK